MSTVCTCQIASDTEKRAKPERRPVHGQHEKILSMEEVAIVGKPSMALMISGNNEYSDKHCFFGTYFI